MFNRAHIPETHYDWRASLELMGNKEAVTKELALLLQDMLPKFMVQLQAAFAKNDPAEIQIAAHKLHGGLCYVIAPRLKYLIHHLETACKQRPEEISFITPYIGSSIDALHAALTQTFK